MASRLISSLARCSVPRASFISRSHFFSTTPLISRTLILRNLFSSSTSLASEDDKIKRADENLLLVLESVIAKKNLRKEVWPKDFQFEITDNPIYGSVRLKREYDGEHIKAAAFRHYISKISLVVTIDRKVGPILEFCCNLTPSAFEIESVSLKSSDNSAKYCYRSPDLSATDKRLYKAFEEYLAARGFTKSLYDCLHYRIDGQEYFDWLGLKEFIEK